MSEAIMTPVYVSRTMARTKQTKRKFLGLITPITEQDGTDAEPTESLVDLHGSASAPGPESTEIEQSMERRNNKCQKRADKQNRKKSSGYGLMARSDVRNEGYKVPVGSDRTCLSDAVWCLLNLLDVTINQSLVREALKPGDEDQRDPNIDHAVSCC